MAFFLKVNLSCLSRGVEEKQLDHVKSKFAVPVQGGSVMKLCPGEKVLEKINESLS